MDNVSVLEKGTIILLLKQIRYHKVEGPLLRSNQIRLVSLGLGKPGH